MKQQKSLKRKALDDSQYNAVMTRHIPLYQYVLSRYDDEVYDDNRAPVVVFGPWLYPLAIELSIFRFDVTFIADDYDDMETIKKDFLLRAARCKEVFWFDYTKNVPRAAFIVFADVLEKFSTKAEVIKYIELLLRRCIEIVCSVKSDRDWNYLEDFFTFESKPYPKPDRLMLRISNKRFN